MLSSCVQAVFSLGKVGVVSNNLRTGLSLVINALCLNGWLMTNYYSAFTSSFALANSSSFNRLNGLLMPTIHTTNKNNEFLYKLITINTGE